MTLKNSLFFAVGLLSLCGAVAADNTPEKAQEYNDNPPYNFHGEIDNTDTYAIQLDSSEEEQNQELDEFEDESKEYRAEHPKK